MAEFVLKDMAKKAGVADKFLIRSVATSTEELGNPVYPPARRKLAEHGIGCSGHAARQITRSDYAHFDLLIGMDGANIRNMQRHIGGDSEGKIHLLLDYAGIHRDVADPWYTGDFEATWQDVNTGCRALFELLLREGKLR
jgi:protein-tyrosine phosphatase